MFPFTTLVRTVGGNFRREKVVQTVTCRKSLQSGFTLDRDRTKEIVVYSSNAENSVSPIHLTINFTKIM